MPISVIVVVLFLGRLQKCVPFQWNDWNRYNFFFLWINESVIKNNEQYELVIALKKHNIEFSEEIILKV